MVPPAVFGIESNALDTAFKLLVLVLAVVWLALVYYTFADARRRIEDPLLIATATGAAFLFPFVGTIVYMIVRPPEFLEDVHERELEIQAAEARLHEQDIHFCPHCEYQVEKAFLRCPNCLRKLKDACQVCSRPLDPDWKLCPYCEAEIPGKTPRRRRRRVTEEHAAAEAPPS